MARCGFSNVCFAVSGWISCVMSKSRWLSSDTVCSMVEALPSAVVLWEIYSRSMSNRREWLVSKQKLPFQMAIGEQRIYCAFYWRQLRLLGLCRSYGKSFFVICEESSIRNRKLRNVFHSMQICVKWTLRESFRNDNFFWEYFFTELNFVYYEGYDLLPFN